MRTINILLCALLCTATMLAQPNVPRSKEIKKAPANASSFSMSDIQNWSGEGSNSAALVIKWVNSENSLVFGYHFDGEKTGADMLNEVVGNNPRLYMLYADSQYGFAIGGLGWDADDNGFTLLDGNKDIAEPDAQGILAISSYSFDGYSSGSDSDYWNSGWYNGYWSYYLSSNSAASPGYASTGCSGRKLSDGCWDMWLYSSFSGESNDWGPLVSAPSNQTHTFVNDVEASKTVAGIKYINLTGQMSNTPFSGINIVVTSYTDGTSRSEKIIR
ncbi:MAG: hypothetical protein ACI30R_04345 [Sodaliphilus sp.]